MTTKSNHGCELSIVTTNGTSYRVLTNLHITQLTQKTKEEIDAYIKTNFNNVKEYSLILAPVS